MQKGHRAIDPTYAANLQTLTKQRNLMIRQMEKKTVKTLKLKDILDRYEAITDVLPVDPLKSLFYIHLKEFMRKFPADLAKYTWNSNSSIHSRMRLPKPVKTSSTSANGNTSNQTGFMSRIKSKFSIF